MNNYKETIFKILDKLNNKYKDDVSNIPKIEDKKYIDVKKYKQEYYLRNIEIYRKRNKEYREEKKLNRNVPED